jgi:O-glycosyl hydrolase
MTKQQLEMLVICAFRYNLGRMTYSVSDFVAFVIENVAALSFKAKALMLKELEYAVNLEKTGFADKKPLGMDMDRKQWLMLLEVLRNA